MVEVGVVSVEEPHDDPGYDDDDQHDGDGKPGGDLDLVCRLGGLT